MFTKYFTKRKRSAFWTLALLAFLILAGCGNSNSTSVSSTSSTSTLTTPAAMQGNSATATLKHVPVGNAVLNWNNTNQMLKVEVMLTGLAPNSTHPTRIYEGSCNNQGKALYTLSNVVADAHGVGHATSDISVPKGIPATGWYLNVHNGPNLSPDDQFLPIACGDIVNHDTSLRSPQKVQVSLDSAPSTSKDQNVSGTAHLQISNHILTVEMTLTNLAPNSEHAAHIHLGTCASQGDVLYPLPTVKADATGKTTMTTTIKNVSTIPANGWYVNVHHSTDISTQTGFDPIACGNVTLA
jgi:hypothetical protein